jgi:type VI secretion system protein ImpF
MTTGDNAPAAARRFRKLRWGPTVRRRPQRQPDGLPLLDRLIDDNRSSQVDPPSLHAWDRPAITRAIREAIGQDLEILLNTRQRLIPPPPDVQQPTQSILDFGLPSARGTNLATAAGRKEFGQTIAAAIRCFEPRIADVQVTVEPAVTPLDLLKLVIEARLTTDPDGSRWQAEAFWSAGSGEVRVEEARP